MVFSDIPVPDVYKESADFRFFLKWIELCFSDILYKTDNLINLLDPLRCPANLLWMLGDTCGYKYDERASIAFNRLVLLYFAKLIRYRGSQTGITLAAELNLAQFSLEEYAKENEILQDRLEDTSIPVNSVAVSHNANKGYIDITYYSEKVPTDICIEYVRPLGMYCFTHAGVDVNARTKVVVDARLTTIEGERISPDPTFIAHYRREDYARLQKYLGKGTEEDPFTLAPRRPVFYRNMMYEQTPKSPQVLNPGYRSLYSLQLCNNEHIVKALMPSLDEPDQIFDMGYDPQNVSVNYPKNYLKDGDYPFNLRINKALEESFTPRVYTVDSAESVTTPKPAVNPVMAVFGDAISLNTQNTMYTKYNERTGQIETVQLKEDEGPNIYNENSED